MVQICSPCIGNTHVPCLWRFLYTNLEVGPHYIDWGQLEHGLSSLLNAEITDMCHHTYPGALIPYRCPFHRSRGSLWDCRAACSVHFSQTGVVGNLQALLNREPFGPRTYFLSLALPNVLLPVLWNVSSYVQQLESLLSFFDLGNESLSHGTFAMQHIHALLIEYLLVLAKAISVLLSCALLPEQQPLDSCFQLSPASQSCPRGSLSPWI